MEELYKRRNISECLGAAWTLTSTNLGRITKALWIPTLIYALTEAIIAPLSLSFAKHSTLNESVAFDGIAIAILTIIGITMALIAYAKTFKLLNEQPSKHNMRRSLKSFLVVAFFFLVAFAIYMAFISGASYIINNGKMAQTIGTIATVVISVLFTIITFILYCPINYTITKYMMEPETKMKHLLKNFRIGMRNLGFIAGSILLCILLMGTIYNITALPAYIATLAATLSNSGVAKGDAAGLPGYFPYICGLTTFVATIVYLLLSVWFTLVSYYMYASIEARNGRTDIKPEETDNNKR